MAYREALEKSWNELAGLAGGGKISVRFLTDNYDVDIRKRKVSSLSCNIPAREHVSIIILHYLIRRLKDKILPEPKGEWISFKQLEGGEGYYPAFKKRTIDIVLRKYGDNPERLPDAVNRFCAKRVQAGDFGITLEPFDKVPILITMWKGDDEFEPEANMHFDASITGILCTEDIVVMTEFVAHSL